MTAAAPIDLGVERELAQIDFASGERRVLLEGDLPFDHLPSCRVVCGLAVDRRSAESYVDLEVPAFDPDDHALRPVRIGFIVARDDAEERIPVTAVVVGPQPIPVDVALFVVERCLKSIIKAHQEGEFVDLADAVDYVGVWILRERATEVEQSVVDALSRDVMRDSDFEVLRRYPARLVAVNQLALCLKEPEVVRRPKGQSRFVFDPPRISFWNKHVNELAAHALAAVERLSGLIAGQQIVLVERQRQETARQQRELERFQRLATGVGAAVLVPSLVAGVFGTNVNFPGAGSKLAFWGVLSFMLAGALGSFGLLRLAELGGTPRWIRWLLERRSPVHRARGALIAAGLFAAGGCLCFLLAA